MAKVSELTNKQLNNLFKQYKKNVQEGDTSKKAALQKIGIEMKKRMAKLKKVEGEKKKKEDGEEEFAIQGNDEPQDDPFAFSLPKTEEPKVAAVDNDSDMSFSLPKTPEPVANNMFDNNPDDEEEFEIPETLTKIRGWLIVFTISLFLAMLSLIVAFISDLAHIFDDDLMSSITSGGEAFIYLDASVIFIFILLLLRTIIFLFTRNYQFQRLTVQFLFFNIVWKFLSIILAVFMAGVPFKFLITDLISAVIGSAVSFLWILYLVKSLRVKARFDLLDKEDYQKIRNKYSTKPSSSNSFVNKPDGEEENDEEHPPEMTGIKGWMIVLLILLILSTLGYFFGSIGMIFASNIPTMKLLFEIPNYSYLIYMQTGVVFIYFIVSAWCLKMFFSRDFRFPSVMIVFAVVDVILQIINVLLSKYWIGLSDQSLTSDYYKVIAGFIVTHLWVWLLVKSKRIKARFGEDSFVHHAAPTAEEKSIKPKLAIAGAYVPFLICFVLMFIETDHDGDGVGYSDDPHPYDNQNKEGYSIGRNPQWFFMRIRNNKLEGMSPRNTTLLTAVCNGKQLNVRKQPWPPNQNKLQQRMFYQIDLREIHFDNQRVYLKLVTLDPISKISKTYSHMYKYDATSHKDTDGDKILDKDDPDIDNDGVPNENDAHPYSSQFKEGISLKKGSSVFITNIKNFDFQLLVPSNIVNIEAKIGNAFLSKRSQNLRERKLFKIRLDIINKYEEFTIDITTKDIDNNRNSYVFKVNPLEYKDKDSDGIVDAKDNDDDNDGVPDSKDPHPQAESIKTGKLIDNVEGWYLLPMRHNLTRILTPKNTISCTLEIEGQHYNEEPANYFGRKLYSFKTPGKDKYNVEMILKVTDGTGAKTYRHNYTFDKLMNSDLDDDGIPDFKDDDIDGDGLKNLSDPHPMDKWIKKGKKIQGYKQWFITEDSRNNIFGTAPYEARHLWLKIEDKNVKAKLTDIGKVRKKFHIFTPKLSHYVGKLKIKMELKLGDEIKTIEADYPK
jgi:hypothetical protein